MVEEYLLAAVAAAVFVVLLELCVLRTGLFTRPAYWVTMVIVLAFQIPVDGWLTKLDAPVVLYADWAISGVRVPWDIPVEDFLYGFAMVTAVLMMWERGRQAREQA
ncbi:lycopene cyclase domain-containing protein [Nocardia sp. NRRL S-836]|uniref:lycopene cyclase domain-containing protein n=1 Tax=Nocardia sp. NRRL S-836 TaxID=1519492 RepID=UPI0006B01F11|nr:lycopene cyclase domain-containing protein [Nocardia sp. NRRL S-836]KOV83837.1 lycopene cyclase [Nocardia sp. NRRL S-836]